jgi:DNA-directed RNA polymerase subunit RPC12/RpoP
MDINIFLLLLLVCGALGIVLVVTIVFSYLWLRYVDAEVRKCPQCQSKGAAEVLEYELVDSRNYVDSAAAQKLPRKFRRRVKPIRVEEKKYQVDYKCKHCGHEWTDFATDKEEVTND